MAIARRFTEAFNRLDLESVIGDLHPDIELCEWPEAPGAQNVRRLELFTSPAAARKAAGLPADRTYEEAR